jgi:hypothetical protein
MWVLSILTIRTSAHGRNEGNRIRQYGIVRGTQVNVILKHTRLERNTGDLSLERIQKHRAGRRGGLGST